MRAANGEEDERGDGGTGPSAVTALLPTLVDLAQDAIIVRDTEDRVVLWNQGAERLYGWRADEAWGRVTHELLGTRGRLSEALDALRRDDAWEGELTHHTRDGRRIVTWSRWSAQRDAGGGIAAVLEANRDVSEERRLVEQLQEQAAELETANEQLQLQATELEAANEQLQLQAAELEAKIEQLRTTEAQLRQAQKMEAVGQLAGGIAHDFNNLLGAIIGYLDFVRPALAEGSEARADLEEVQAAASRATRLTRQLLAFSRRQVLQLGVIDPNEVVRGIGRLVERVIGENIRVRYELADGVGSVQADVSQLEQVLLNLVVNARDAMPHGGTIRVRTSTRASTDPEIATRVAHASDVDAWMLIEVEDSGTGMDAETIERAFEPFFTTKPPGKGTGLGLSTVYGIVAHSGGRVWIESAPRAGTCVTIALPRRAGEAEAPGSVASGPAPAQRGHRVLVVEDDDALRTLERRVLASHGYDVVEARDGKDALARWVEQGRARPFDAVITDVVMPDLGGRELVAELRRRAPTLPVLYVSGYAGDVVADLELAEGTALVTKPFTGTELLEQLRALTESR